MITNVERDYFNSLVSAKNNMGQMKTAKELFEDSIKLAELVGVPDDYIMKTTNDIDKYFLD